MKILRILISFVLMMVAVTLDANTSKEDVTVPAKDLTVTLQIDDVYAFGFDLRQSRSAKGGIWNLKTGKAETPLNYSKAQCDTINGTSVVKLYREVGLGNHPQNGWETWRRQGAEWICSDQASNMITSSYTQTTPKKKAVYGSGFYVSPTKYNYTERTRQITDGARTDYDKARAIYLWMCANVDFDPTGKIRTADECWENRKAVCQGYCELFFRMAETVGLKVKLINGNGKNLTHPDELERHVWLIASTERGEVLMDPTWGAGLFVNGKFMRHPEPLMWFDTDPRWFIMTHMPQKRNAQLLKRIVKEEEFRQMPYANPLLAKLGLTPQDAFQRALAGGEGFPHLPITNLEFLQKVRIKNVPQVNKLNVGESYTFEVEKADANCSVAIDNEGCQFAEEIWSKDGQTYSLRMTPSKAGKLKLTVTNNHPFLPTTKVVVEYDVK